MSGLAAAAGGLGIAGLTSCSPAGGGSGKTLQFMYWGSTFEQKAIDAMLDQFEARHEGVTVEPLYTPEEYDAKLNTLVASNQAPDVAYVPVDMAYRLAESGKLVNLFPYLDDYPEFANNLPGTYLWHGKDKLLGTQTANEVLLLWYNKTVFDDAGVDYPPANADEAWTWDQLVENAYKLTRDRNGKRPDEPGFDPKDIEQFGVSSAIDYAPAWYSFLRSRGVDFVDESGRKCLLDTPEAIEVFQNLQDLTYKHHVAPTPGQMGGTVTTGDAPATNVLLQSKRVAMINDGQWILLDMSQSDIEYGIGVLPKYKEPIACMVSGASCVFKSTEHVKNAVELFAFHNDPRYVDLNKDGLWMPLQKKYYEDPEFVDKWVDNDVHPPEFKTAVVDYTLNHGETIFSQRLKNMENINDAILIPALQQIQTGKGSAKEILTEVTPKIDERLQGWWPDQEV